MSINYARRPKITWGSGSASTLTIGYPLDNWRSYSTHRDGSEFAQTMSGVRDAWIAGEDFILEGDVRWIPTTSSVAQSGWDDAWRPFLTWARAQNTFRYYPDANSSTYYTSYLLEPLTGEHGLEGNATRSIRIKITNASASYAGY